MLLALPVLAVVLVWALELVAEFEIQPLAVLAELQSQVVAVAPELVLVLGLEPVRVPVAPWRRKKTPAGTLLALVLILPSAFSLYNLLYFILVPFLARLHSAVACH